jgi:hypothetical protein
MLGFPQLLAILGFSQLLEDEGVKLTIERRIAKEVTVVNFLKKRRIL